MQTSATPRIAITLLLLITKLDSSVSDLGRTGTFEYTALINIIRFTDPGMGKGEAALGMCS